MRALHAALFAPEGATLVIVGDRPEEELLDAAARCLANGPRVPSPMAIDRAAALAPPPPARWRGSASCRGRAPRSRSCASATSCAARSTPDYHALLMLNTVLGGQFVSRINLNLREDKGYTYGVRTGFDLRRGIGPFVLQTSVGTTATADAMREALKELREIAGARPVTPDELSLAQPR